MIVHNYSSLISASCTLFLSASLQLAVAQLPLVTMDEANQSWLNPNVWDNDAAPSADFDYILADVGNATMRSSPQGQVAGGPANFPGNSLTVPVGTTFLVKQISGQTASILSGEGDLILDGGRVVFGPNFFSSPRLNVADLHVTSTTGSQLSISTGIIGRTATLDGRLTGPGDLLVDVSDGGSGPNGGILSIAEVDEAGFQGMITVRNNANATVQLDFNEDIHFQVGAGIELIGIGVLRVDQALVFEAGKLIDPVNGIVPPGVYAGADLVALGANYVDAGGTLTVLDDIADVPSIESLELIESDGVVSQVNFTFSGLDSSKMYRLVRGIDLQSFPDLVVCFSPEEDTATASDLSPLSGVDAKAFYRLEETLMDGFGGL